MPLTIDACVAQHIGDRREQQDRAGLFQHPRDGRIVLGVVADGMGGHSGGALAAEQVLFTVRSSLEHFSPAAETAAAMVDAALREAHLLIRGGRFINEQDPHSTAVVLLLQPRGDGLEAVWAHCGDSRLYLFRGCRLRMQTRDHSYVEALLGAGKINRDEAAVHPQRNVLVTSLGGAQTPRIDTGGTAELRAGDSFLLCSDGLWAAFRTAELGALLSSLSAREAAETMFDRVRQRSAGRGDNCSLVILRLVEAGVPAARPR